MTGAGYTAACGISAIVGREAPRTPARFGYVLWDCDGTLLDTIGDLAAAGNHVCEHFGWPTFSLAEYKMKLGDGQRKLVERIVPPRLAGDEDLLEDAYVRFLAHYADHKRDTTAPYPGIVDLLERLDAAGVSMGVLTNKNHGPAVQLIHDYFGDLVPFVVGRVDGVPAKPDPAMTRELMDRMGADPARTLMVGDTSVDIACGTNAGIASAGVLWGFRGRDELVRAGATWIAATPDELCGIVLGR